MKKLQLVHFTIGGLGDACSPNQVKQLAMFGHGGYGNVCFQLLMLIHQHQKLILKLIAFGNGIEQNVMSNVDFGPGINGNVYFRIMKLILMSQLIAQNNGIDLNACSKQSVVFGAGGGHGNVFFNLKMFHQHAHFGTGGLMGAYSNSQE